VSILQRWLGGQTRSETGDTEVVRRIAARLSQLPPDRASWLAAFAFVLARVANADLRITESETDAMQTLVAEVAGIRSDEAALAVEIAKSQQRLLGGTENYVVTREFRELSDRAQRTRLLECLFAVAAADGTISSEESTEIAKIADELGFTRAEMIALRTPWLDKLSALRDLPKSS
jgi:uncharacterized tellurite resistance protein B-like protein